MENVKFKFYATLLDAYQDYLDSELIWEKYWGWSVAPPHTPEEFKQVQYQSLIDKINRVPYESDAADKGIAFNEVIDCILLHKKSAKIHVEKIYDYIADGLIDPCTGKPIVGDVIETGKVKGLNVVYNGKEFYFPMSLVRKYTDYYKGSLPQVYVQSVLTTIYGDVQLYGYIDYLMPFCVHDLKTTHLYTVGKYKRHWQHKVYPYALINNGCEVYDFEYNITEIGKTYYRNYKEFYTFEPKRDVPLLREHCEGLVKFITENRALIKDKKIFNSENKKGNEYVSISD